MRKIQRSGTLLTRTEMKAINGGTPPQILWKCLIDGYWYAEVCRSEQPQIPCMYDAPCEALGPCEASLETCIN
ncbi:MAG: hypothetical protein QM731_25410 [Chitinophagaceae bacterium]